MSMLSWRQWIACALLVSAGAAWPAAPQADASDADRWLAVRALLHEAQVVKGWRPAYEKALQRPRDGGIWLATVIVQRCAEAERVVTRYVAQLASHGASGASLRERQRAAYRLDELCAGFAQESADAETRLQRLLGSPEANLDPLLELQRRYRDALQRRDAGASDAALAEAVALGSSLFFERLEAGSTRDGRVFDGRLYADEPRGLRALYDAALFLAVCDAWNDCPESDYVLLRGCVERSLCAQFRHDYVPLVMAATPAAIDTSELHGLTDRMYSALRSGAVERFR